MSAGLASVITALCAGIAAVIAAWAGRRKQATDEAKTEADTSDVVTVAAERVVKVMQATMDTMADRMTALEADVAGLRKELAVARGVEQELRNQVGVLTSDLEAAQAKVARLEAKLQSLGIDVTTI